MVYVDGRLGRSAAGGILTRRRVVAGGKRMRIEPPVADAVMSE
jgi:hypothetical protein